jgi:hypothetical protein
MDESDFYTQRTIWYVKCDFNTHESDLHSHECDFDTHELNNDTHECDLYPQNVMSIRMSDSNA